VYSEREGFLLRVRGHGGLYGLGDVAPLFGFSPESPDDARQQWNALRGRVEQLNLPESVQAISYISMDLQREHGCCQSLLFGIEVSLAELAAKTTGVELARWLNPDAGNEIEVNALLHAPDSSELQRQAIEKAEAGYRTFKLKVGSAPITNDVARIRAVRDAVPSGNIRIDANAAWDARRFRDLCGQIAPFGLEFVEQPLPIGEAQHARDISSEFGVPLALDEEAESGEDAQRLIEQRLCDVLVLKPMVVGGLIECLRLAKLAEMSQIGVVFTSVWESDVGLAATLHLAAACRGVSRAAGLSTAGIIAAGLVGPALRIERGRLHVPARPGLGLELT
jgi:o-succinylbenzoate synthase